MRITPRVTAPNEWIDTRTNKLILRFTTARRRGDAHRQEDVLLGQGSLDTESAMQKNVSSALFGGEGLFQTRIRGLEICVLESLVPSDEVLRINLKDETLQVDGNFDLMRTGRIEFSVENSTRSLLETITSGERLL